MDDLSGEWYSFSTLKGYESTVWSMVWSPYTRLIPGERV
jgi:hypothetical protein